MYSEMIGKRALALRKVWATGLVPIMDRLPQEIDELLHSSCAVLHQTLRRVCAQLADLGPNMASIVARWALFEKNFFFFGMTCLALMLLCAVE